jgi:hypothetical protein
MSPGYLLKVFGVQDGDQQVLIAQRSDGSSDNVGRAQLFSERRDGVRVCHAGLHLEAPFVAYGAVDAGARRRAEDGGQVSLKGEQLCDGLPVRSLSSGEGEDGERRLGLCACGG